MLPVPVAKLRDKYPKVNISLHQGAPDQVAKMLLDDTAEIGIATGRLPPRGPIGPEQLTTWKYLVLGDGQTRP